MNAIERYKFKEEEGLDSALCKNKYNAFTSKD